MDSPWFKNFMQFDYYMKDHCSSLPDGFLELLRNLMSQAELQNNYGKPMVWIGIYIAIASLFCILPMLADLIHGFYTKKLWFPCKYFTLNAASLTVIAVAMKLPMDLNSSMPGNVDQGAKYGSMAFMCTMMANILPSLATMESKELLTNIIALGILVITLIVNVCIQMKTGVTYSFFIPILYVAMLLALLMIHICSALMIIKSKQILESKYKEAHETTLKNLELQQPTIEKLKQHVINHWIMAGTGSPQFTVVCSATTSAAGVICVFSTLLHAYILYAIRPSITFYGSDYKWSVLVIFITQFSGVILGTFSPLARCFASLSFKVSIKWIWNHIRVFKVESYYTQKLCDCKQSDIPFKSSSRRCKIVIQDLKVLVLSICIGLQKIFVVICKVIALIPIFFVIGVLCCFHCWKWLKVMFNASNNVLVRRPSQLQHNKDLSQYVLQLQDDMQLGERTLKSISKSVNRVIRRAEKKQPNNLMKLLEKSNGFKGVGNYDVHQVLEAQYVDCWSLPIVTLATIAISLPKIQKDIVKRLIKSVTEGLTYVKHVEETLNARDEYAIVQKAAKSLWLGVEIYHRWLGNKLVKHAHQVNTPKEIVQWFSLTAKNMVTEVESKNNEDSDDTLVYISVCANSMFRITQTILESHHADIDQVSQEELFVHLSLMISDILSACLTNLPQVIEIKCHTSVIEKREASVHTVAQLLGETMQIISSLQDCQLPSLNPDELPYIDKWRDCFLQHSP